MEGVASEAASLAGHLKLGKLIYLYDNNHITLSASTQVCFSENCEKRFDAYGWHTQIIDEGNDLDAIYHAIEAAQIATKRPSLIIIRTHIGYGSPHKHDTFEAHGSPLGVEEVKLTKQHLAWPINPSFYVPKEAAKHFHKANSPWPQIRKTMECQTHCVCRKISEPSSRIAAIDAQRNYLQAGMKTFHIFPADSKGMATREASAKVMQAINPNLPGFIGGSADLNASTKTELINFGNFQNPYTATGDLQGSVTGGWNYAGRNLYYGVREHAMGAISNGLATFNGIIPFTATFLIFSDYLRPTIRLAALMGMQVIYVFTHDSIGIRRGWSHASTGRTTCKLARHSKFNSYPSGRCQ